VEREGGVDGEVAEEREREQVKVSAEEHRGEDGVDGNDGLWPGPGVWILWMAPFPSTKYRLVSQRYQGRGVG
jgi:hypothetical protein